MALRELLLKLGVQVDKNALGDADKGLKNLKKAALAAGAAFAAIGAGRALFGMIDQVRELGDELDKTSKQLGLSVEALQEMRFAAGLAGVAGQEMSNSLGRLQKNAFEAAKGNKTLQKDFRKLGIDVRDASGELKSGEQLLLEFADGIQGLDNDSEKVALSLNLMGRTGRKLLPLFADGAEGIDKMRAEARALGAVMSKELIDETVKLTDNQHRLSQAWQGVKNTIAEAVLPEVNKFLDGLVNFAKENNGPIKRAIVGLIDRLGGVRAIMIGLASIVGTLAIVMVAAAVKIAAAWILANLPIIGMTALILALIVIVGLLIEDLVTFFRGGDSLIGRLIAGFKKWVREMGGVSGAIIAIAKKLFEDIFGFSEEFTNGVIASFGALVEIVDQVLGGIGRFIGDTVFEIVEVFKNAFGNIEEGFWGILKAAGQIAAGLAKVFWDAINSILEGIGELLVAFTDAVGITSTEEDDARVRKGVAAIEKNQRQQSQRKRAIALERARIFRQLEAEGLGRVVNTPRGASFQAAEGQKAIAEQRLLNLTQTGGASTVNVSVDASNRSNPGAIADEVARRVDQVQKERQAAQNFATAAP